MVSKKELMKNYLVSSYNYICPICDSNIELKGNEMICPNKHSFNISKKGVLCLLNTGKFKTNFTYDKNLFVHRRRFMSNEFYSELFNKIAIIINNYKNNGTINVIDLGCGEGIIDKKILNKIEKSYCFLGIDYNKDAINLATDYNDMKTGFIVSDMNNIPLSNKSVDIIINILSPYYSKEVKRVLKDEGILIKVIPDENYLIELRKALGFNQYEKVELLKSKLQNSFNLIDEIIINETYNINENQLIDLCTMTPLVKSKKLIGKDFNNLSIETITINLRILVMRRK